MKTILRTVLLLICSILSLTVRAIDIDGLNYGYFLSDMTCRVTGLGALHIEPFHLIISESVKYEGKTYKVTLIAAEAFQGKSGIVRLTIPNSVTIISNFAFSGCWGLIGELIIPNSVTFIGNYAFSDCSGLTGSLTIPNSVTSIGHRVFERCRGFTGTLTLSESLESIGELAFKDCEFQAIKSLNPTPPTLGANNDGMILESFSSSQRELNLYVPDGSINAYKEAKEWMNFKNILPLSDLEKVEATAISITPSTVEIVIGSTSTLSVTITPANTTDKTVTWKSSDESVATVDATGLVTAKKAGTVTITATCGTVSATCAVTVKPILATSVTLNATTRDITIGGTSQLTATVKPDNTTDKTVTWKSSDEAVATVDATGLVTAKKVGTATITATCGTVSATCAVTVKPILATSITLNATTRDITIGGTSQLTATVKPDNTTDKTVTWKSSDEAVATVDATGLVTAKKVGTATITATCGTVSATCAVTVKAVLATKIELNKKSITDLHIHHTATLTTTITPTSTTDKTVTWTSSNPEVASVDALGKITGLSFGETTITAATSNGKTATCKVTVIPWSVEGVEYERVPGGGPNGEDIVKVISGKPDEDGTLTLPEEVEIDGAVYIVSEIAPGAFKNNTDITKLIIPKTVVTIGDEAFSGCTSLADVEAQNGAATLACGTDAFKGAPIATLYLGRNTTGSPFAGNNALADLQIGKNVTAISAADFKGCTAIMDVWGYPTVPPALPDDGFEQSVFDNATLHVTDASSDAYKTADGWKKFVVTQGLNEVLPESMTLSIPEIELKERGTMTLTVTFTPAETTNKKVTWRSSNTKVATVNVNGRVTAVKAGTAVITATAQTTTADGETPTATCSVTVVPQTGTSGGIGYEIVIGGGENGEDIIKVTGGDPDPDGTLTIPDDIEIDGVKYPVREIAPGAFKDRTDIKKVVIPATVETIGDEAFAGCTNLTEVVAEDGEEILACGADAFKDAPVEKLYLGRDTSGLPFMDKNSLISLTFGDKVTVVDPSDFEGCTSIKNITALSLLPPEVFEESFEESIYGSATLRVPDSAVADYKAHEVWGKFYTLVGESDILPIDIELALTSARLIEGESLPLTAILTPDNSTVTTLLWSSSNEAVAAVNATGMVTAVKAGNATITATTVNGLTATCTVKVIAKSGTSGDLNYEIIPGEGEGGEKKPSITITGGETDPDGTLRIPDDIEIDGVKYPVTEVAPGAFKDRTDIKEVIISKNVETVGDEAFAGCTNLKKVVEEDGEKLLTFGKDAFKDAPIEELYHGRNHGGNPYAGNDNLTKVEIGDKVTAIGSGEYAGCKNITDVVITNPVPPVLADDAFEQAVFDRATLTVPDGSKDAYKAAAGWNKFFTVVEESEIPVVSVEMDVTALTIVEGTSQQLIATVTPDDATDASLIWTSSNTDVATVGADGTVKAVKAGTATITATTANGLTATCAVTVTAKPTGIDGVEADGAPAVSVEGGDILISGNGVAEVFSLTGSRVAVTSAGRVSSLPRGTYLVRTAGKTYKVRL